MSVTESTTTPDTDHRAAFTGGLREVAARPNPEREAIAVLAERGWCKRAFEDDAGRVCLGGAVNHTESVNVVGVIDWVNNLRSVIAEQFSDRTLTGGLFAFNDHSDTTIDDVILVLEKAAIRRDEAVTDSLLREADERAERDGGAG